MKIAIFLLVVGLVLGEQLILQKTLEKIGANNCTQPVTNSMSQIGLTNCNNLNYYGTVGIGTPPQNFTMIFDTESTTTWIPMNGCNGCSRPMFNQLNSSTANVTNQPESITYHQSIAMSGYVGSDYITLFGTNVSVNTEILFVNQVTSFTFGANGIIGLGLTTTSSNLFDNAYAAGQIETNVFALQLQSVSNNSILYYNQIPDWITNSTYYLDNYHTNDQDWQVQCIGIEIGGLDFSTYASRTAIVSSSMNYFYLNTNLFLALKNQFIPNCYYNGTLGIVICQTTCSNVPNVTFSFYLKGIQINIQVSDISEVYDKNWCQINFGPVNQDLIYLGQSLLRNYVVTFDKDNSKVGFSGDYQIISLIGKTSQRNLYKSQIVMSGFAVLLIISFSILFGLTWKGKQRKRSLQQQLGNYVAF